MSGATIDRRHVLKILSAVGVGSAVFGRALCAMAADAPQVTDEMIRQAAWISGTALTDDQRKLMLEGINQTEADYAKLRAVTLSNAVPQRSRSSRWRGPECRGPRPSDAVPRPPRESTSLLRGRKTMSRSHR